jgi:peptide/nickel transport system permease protein
MEEIVGIARRILHALILLIAVIVLNFVLMRLAPGDVAQVIAGEMGGVTEEILADIRAQYGLDKSIAEQLFIFLGRFARLDFGESYFYNQPVIKLIFGRVPATLLLVLSALIFSTTIGTIIGVISARRPHSFLSHLVTFISVGGYSMPFFGWASCC